MVVSPWAKRGYVGKVHYSFGSIFKTFWNVLGLPYLNQYDAGATDLADLFADHPDPVGFLCIFTSGHEDNRTRWSNEAFDRLKEQGKARFLGFSSHTPRLEEIASAAIETVGLEGRPGRTRSTAKTPDC